MRSLAAFLTGLIAVVAIVVALPAIWATERVVDPGGFRATATTMGQSPQVRTFMADAITTQVANRAGTVAAAAARPFAQRYTQSARFTDDFVDLAVKQHRWLFSPAPPGVDSSVMYLDLTDMVRGVAAQAGLALGPLLTGPILVPVSRRDRALEAGRYRVPGRQLHTLAYGSIVIGVLAAVLALLFTRRLSAIVAWLGLGGVVSAAAAWFGGYYFAARAKAEAAVTEAAVRQVAEATIDGLVDDLHRWALVAGGAGAALLVTGLVARVLTGD